MRQILVVLTPCFAWRVLCVCRYNTVMKIIFLASTFSIIYLIRAHKVIRHTYDREQDTFRYQFLVIPCAVLAVFTGVRTPVEVSALRALTHMQHPTHVKAAGLVCGVHSACKDRSRRAGSTELQMATVGTVQSAVNGAGTVACCRTTL